MKLIVSKEDYWENSGRGKKKGAHIWWYSLETLLRSHLADICTTMVMIRHWLDSFQQPGELVRFHWSIKQTGTQVTGKQGLEAPIFLTRCIEAALDHLDRWREADGGTEHLCRAQEQYSRNSKEQSRAIPTSSNVYITAIVIYTYACVYIHAHIHIYMKKYKASKQSHFKRNTLFLWHTENTNDDYTSSVEAFMNTM